MSQPLTSSNNISPQIPVSPKKDVKIGAVIVTYNPNISSLETLLKRLLTQVDLAVLVDNGSDNVKHVQALVNTLNLWGKHFLETILNQDNEGIAFAQNQGLTFLAQNKCDFLVLSDQDSLPDKSMVKKLHKCFIRASERTPGNVPVAAVGPIPVDIRGEKNVSNEPNQPNALVYSFTKWGPKRKTIPAPSETMEVPFVLASGCMIPTEVFLHVGPMDQSLFIDHVDLAWCLRAISLGYRILVCGDANLKHSLGENRMELPWGRKVHVQSVTRNYYMVRNTIFLFRAPFMPWRWKLGYLTYLTKYLAFYTAVGCIAPKRLTALAAGLWDGALGRTGHKP